MFRHLIAAAILAAGFTADGMSAPAEAYQRPAVVVPDSEFITAVREGRMDDVKAQIAMGTRVDSRGKEGSPALILALLFSQQDVARYLLEQGANPDARDKAGNTALCYATQSGDAEMADALLKAGARPDRSCANRDTPLILAVRAGRASVVNVLIKHGADIEATDLTGRSALSLAQERRYNDIAAALQEAGAAY